MKISSFQPMNVYEAPGRQAAAAKQAPKPEEQNAAASAQQQTEPELLSQEEKQYFARLYPDESKTISSYATYSRTGVTKPSSVGSLIDKKS
jgi:hypothetical protein